ncbi:LysR family transcriptional regulator [Caproicibacter sp. BJN0012]|uniref:LysR family transcriptional regulator n=1 Tax=Caproicibacter sp. BJN0012 TaxID=3110227 RepID=UPI002E131E39
MEFRDILYVLNVAETKNFTQAANNLFVSQPALSQSIQRLEHELGTCLFQRSHHQVALTPAGETFCRDGKKILELTKQMKKNVQETDQLKNQKLSIGVSPFYEKYYLSQILPEFKKQYSDIDIRVIENYTYELEQLVKAGKLDLCIMTLPLTVPTLSFVPIFKEKIVLAVPPRHWSTRLGSGESGKKNPPIDLALFKDEPYIMYKPGRRMRKVSLQLCREAGFSPNIVFETQSCEAINAMITQGMGVGFLPIAIESLCPHDQRPVYYSINSQRAVRTFAIVYDKKNGRSPTLNQFIKMIPQKTQGLTKPSFGEMEPSA